MRKTRMTLSAMVLLISCNLGYAHQKLDKRYLDTQLSVEERTEILLRQMTVEEKVNQLCSGFLGFKSKSTTELDDNTLRKLKEGMGSVQYINTPYTAGEDERLVNSMQRYVKEHSRLGIPLFIQGEALHGHVAFGAASFPQAIALASTWDRALVEEVFTYVSSEARSRGTNFVFSPVLDLGRDPRWGRMEETYGEDPYLVSQIGLACVRGFQGRGPVVDATHIVSSPKHFAGYGQCDGGRNFAPSMIPEQTFYEEILAPFRLAIREGHIRGTMPSHSELNGVPAHGNQKLLTDILRQDLGFEGVVVSDYHDIERLNILHHIVGNNEEAAIEALKAGVNMDLPVSTCYRNLPDIIARHPEYMKYLDQRVKEILRLKIEMGLFENPYCNRELYRTTTARREELTRRAAAKAITLLKNENGVLPLKKEGLKRIALIGPNADRVILGGYSPRRYEAVSIKAGLEEYLKGENIEVVYAKGCDITKQKSASQFEVGNLNSGKIETRPLAEEEESIAAATRVAAQCDVTLLCLGDNYFTTREAIFPEGNLGDRANLNLAGNQDELARRILALGKPVVVILMHGRSLTVNHIADKADGIIDAWYLGEQTGHVVARTLFGEINPGGKLPVSIPRSSAHLPVYYNQKESANLKSYLFEDNSPLWPFGYGLSYTEFSISNVKLDKEVIGRGEGCEVRATVTNTGKYTGDEVVQVYIHDEVASVTRPRIQLRGFERVTLAPGESKEVSIALTADDFSLFNRQLKQVTEPGTFSIYVSNSSVVDQSERLVLEIKE